jgi:hypothetical protein
VYRGCHEATVQMLSIAGILIPGFWGEITGLCEDIGRFIPEAVGMEYGVKGG